MTKERSQEQPDVVRPADRCDLKVLNPFLIDEDERLLSDTFLRMAELCHTLPPKVTDDCLLLLTTCRNEWYTVNAMYAEAKKWCQEGGKFTGFGDALDALRGAVTGTQKLEKAINKAKQILKTTAEYLYQFEYKHALFFDRFQEVHGILTGYCENIKDPIARESFRRSFVEYKNGPKPEDYLKPPSNSVSDVYQDRLLDWFSVVRPLTGLARTYVGGVQKRAKAKGKTCSDYLDEIQLAQPVLEAYGYRCPTIPDVEVFQHPMISKGSGNGSVVIEHLFQFIVFCEELCGTARLFLREMLPGNDVVTERFLLKEHFADETVEIHGKRFKPMADAFVLITDMRNSMGDRYLAPELKVFTAHIIDRLCDEGIARSHTVYDDCRVIACESVENFVSSAARLWNALEVRRTQSGFSGLRMGALCGEILLDYAGEWVDVLKAAPLDSSLNTIAKADRLMGLDKARWGETEQGKVLRERLGDLHKDESLMFIDSSVYERLPESAQERCHDIGILPLRTIGPKQCWAIPIPALAATDR